MNTVYLSRIELNPQRRAARKLLGSPQAMHAAVMSCFPRSREEEAGRVLWRVDNHGDTRFLYLQSRLKPELAVIEEQAGWPSSPTGVTGDLTASLTSLESGQYWGFRLAANPSHVVTENGKKKRMAHVTVDHQTRWFMERTERLGIAIPSRVIPGDDETEYPCLSVIGRGTLKFQRRPRQEVTLGYAVFEGQLQVTDPDRLREAITNGVGRGKGYGLGLLTLVPAS